MSEILTVTPAWYAAHPGATYGLVAFRGVHNPASHEGINAAAADLEDAVRQRFAADERDALRATPPLPAYAAYYKRWGQRYHVGMQLESVALKLFTGIEKFEIMAIPFFILAGNFLTHGGVARRMINFASSMVGHWYGGLGLAGVLACALFVRRMSELFRAEPEAPPKNAAPTLAWRLHGVLFFGAASKIDPLAQAIEAAPQGVQVHLDIHDLFALDTTGLEGLEQILKAVAERGGRLTLSGAQAQPASLMERSGFNVRLAAQSAAPQGPAAASAPGHSPSSGETPG